MKFKSLIVFTLILLFTILGLSISPYLLLGAITVAIIFLFVRRTGILKD